ncbi:MAG: CRISPR-associated protein Csx16 [Rhodocyclaceae bacterium]|nr:CRISPR-associated protein Csx16 [Rhodocyclaceae bacterium]
MTTFFVSRHPGAVAWASRQGLAVDRLVAHLDTADIQPGDVVVGTLPVNLAAEVCRQGGRYLHLALELPLEMRGRELSADDLERFGACIAAYTVEMAPAVGPSSVISWSSMSG